MKKSKLTNLATEGFYMPAEWETHSSTMLIWPHNRSTWPGETLEKVEAVYVEIIKNLHTYEPILLFVADENIRGKVVGLFEKHQIKTDLVKIVVQPVNDIWARDCGPIFIKNKTNQFLITNWEYNSWGEKYPPWSDDNQLPLWIAASFGLTAYSTNMVLEGGSIETNGEGLFLTTESVLLNKNRNPTLSKKDIEEYLKNYLGAEKVIWLKEGLTGDDTDGHIDDLTRFVNKNTVITAYANDEGDVNYRVLNENYERLKSSKDQNGNLLNVIPIPVPKTKIEGETVDGSEYVPASYANFYIANGVVLVPLYDEHFDEEILDLFAEYFPDRDIKGIHCADLVWGQGSIHCVTQQLYDVTF
ncbi:MAG: agmatine deiminase family protein [Balneolaceae bacterium]